MKKINTWREDWKVGRFVIDLNNEGNQGFGKFVPGEAVEIRIGGLLLLDAAALQKNVYVDNPLSYYVGQPVTLDDDTPDTETNTIASITSASNLITMVNNLVNNYTVAQNAILLPNPRHIMKGYVDNSVPRGLPKELSTPEILQITGRAYGRDLARLYHTTVDYTDGLTVIGTQLDAIIVATGTEITSAFGAVHNAKPSTWKRTFMLRGFRELCEQDNLLVYVKDDKSLVLVDLDAPVASGITLKSVAEAIDNNVLNPYVVGEAIGESIVNYIEVIAGNVDDHWTEGNASDYANANDISAIINETTIKLVNNASIRGTVNAGGAQFHYFMLPVAAYHYPTGLDYSNIGEAWCHAYMRHNAAGVLGFARLFIFLEDDDSNIIYWNTGAGSVQGLPAGMQISMWGQNMWWKIPFPLGADYNSTTGKLQAADFEVNKWTYHTQNTNFTWKITKIGAGSYNIGAGEFIYLDGLFLDGTEAKSIFDDGEVSPAKSMLPVYRTDLTSQIALDLLSAQMGAQMKVPMETLTPVAVGQLGSVYNGQTLLVNTPGIATVAYRIQMLHHAFGDDIKDRWGVNHITDYFLLKQTI